jgi:hypothetical protein
VRPAEQDFAPVRKPSWRYNQMSPQSARRALRTLATKVLPPLQPKKEAAPPQTP